MSQLPRALVAVALVGAALVPLALVATVAPASAATFNVQTVPGTRFLNDVACPTSTTCVAAGQFDDATGGHGVLVPIINGVAGAPQVVDGTATLRGVACSDDTNCVAVGSSIDLAAQLHAVVVPFTITEGSVVVGAVQTLSDAQGLNDVACSSATSCVAVGGQSGQGVVVPITDGTAGAAQLIPAVSRGLTGVDCYSPTACTAVGLHVVGLTNDGVLVQITDGTAGAAQIVAGTRNLNRIACGPSICEATGTRDATPRVSIILPVINGVPGAFQPVPSDPVAVSNLFGISCPTDTFCAAVGFTDQGVLVPVYGGVPAAPQVVPGTGQLFGVACPTTATCIAVGNTADGTVGQVVAITDLDETTLTCTPDAGGTTQTCTVNDSDGVRTVLVKNTDTNTQQDSEVFDCATAPTSTQFTVPTDTRYKVFVTDCNTPREKSTFVIRTNGDVNPVTGE